MQLITYADRLGGDLRGLEDLLNNEFEGLFSGVHILPFFDPIDGADAGFDPVDHTRVDPRLGDWSDVARLAEDYTVMADLIVNHVSADSPQFEDVRRRGRASEHWDLFLRKEDVFREAGSSPLSAADVDRIYRPRPGKPFTRIELDDGTVADFWTTFSEKQLDINVETVAGKAYLESIVRQFARAGIREIRLDAAELPGLVAGNPRHGVDKVADRVLVGRLEFHRLAGLYVLDSHTSTAPKKRAEKSAS